MWCLRVYVQKTPPGGFWDGHTEEREGKEGEGRGVTVSSANHETVHVELSRASERVTVRNPWF